MCSHGQPSPCWRRGGREVGMAAVVVVELGIDTAGRKRRRREKKKKPTGQARVIKLHVPQPSLVQRVQLRLVDLGHVLEVLGVARVHALLPRLVLLVAHVEPGRRDDGELDVPPPLPRRRRLHQAQLVQVAGAGAALGPRQPRARHDAVPRHHLAVRLDERHHVRVVEPEQRRLGLLQRERALELVPHEAPEARAVELARRHGAQPRVRLQLHHVRHRPRLERRQPGLLGRLVAPADGLARVEEGLRAEERAQVLGAEGRRHDILKEGGRE